MLVEDKQNLLEQLKGLSGNLYVVGAGKFGTIFGIWLSENNIDYQGYIDQRKEGFVNDKPIIKNVEEENKDAIFLISSYVFQTELIDNLLSQGIQEEQIISLAGNDLQYDIYEEISNWKGYTKRTGDFYKKHSNLDRCFVIGNGPSLKIDDLNRLKNETTFASNSIYALYESTSWRPTYYCAWDPVFCTQMMSDKENLKKIMNGCKAAFTSVVGEGFKFRDDKEFQNLYFVSSINKIDTNTNLPFFSDDCSEEVYASGTITYCMLQLAAYMGFKIIYLLGMDCTFSHERKQNGEIHINNMQNHMTEIEKEEDKFSKTIKDKYGYNYIADIDMLINGYIAAKKYSETHDIKIYNATRGGKLEVFDRVDFDSLF